MARKRRKEIGETEQELVARRAREKEERLQRIEDPEEREFVRKGGTVIRGPEGQVVSRLTREESENLADIRKKGGTPISEAVRERLGQLGEPGFVKELTPLEKQELVLERERRRREGEPEITELPPEELPPVTEPGLVEPEGERLGIFGAFKGGYEALQERIEKGELVIGEAPITPAGGLLVGKAALNTVKAVAATRATKAWVGMLKLLKENWKKLAKWGTIGYALWSERSIGNIDSALSQVRESITLPVSIAASNPNRITDAFDMITDLEEEVREYESDVKLKEIYSPTFKLTGRTRPIYQRIKKLRAAIDLARTQIAKTEALGIVLTDEETILMTNEINQIINQMEEPSKFLGIL